MVSPSARLPAPVPNPIHRGEGQFVYSSYMPLAHKPIPVFYYVPTKGAVAPMRILFSMHGADNVGQPQVMIWRDFAEAHGFIVIAPEYPKALYNERMYQFGNVYGPKQLNPKEMWTYNTIEAIFDYVKRATGNTSAVYDMWGHSAGGQFAHRFVWAMPDARVNMAVASNPGSWAFPYPKGLTAASGMVYGWPYSIKGLPYDSDTLLRRTFAKRLCVHVGALDTATSGPHMATDEAALAQGSCRRERGVSFFAAGQKVAREMGAEFNWKRVVAEGIGHGGRSMVYGFSRPRADGKSRIFDINHITSDGAFYLIFMNNNR